MTTPHYLRVARALALVSGLAGATACYASHETGDELDAGRADAGRLDAGMRDAGPRDAGMRDAGMRDAGPRDASDPCSTCGCYSVFGNDGGPGGPPDCYDVELWECCPVVGPLFPPDLPA